MEGLNVANADLTVYIHPSMANKVRQAVNRQLSSLLFTYNDIFDGVLLAFGVSREGDKGKILPGLIPYIGVDLTATLLLFSPKPDMLLEGKVVKLGNESIHLIVLGFCSAAIMSEDIRDEFKYAIKGDEGIFVSKFHKRHKIKEGSILRFSLKSLDEDVLHISGSLIPTNTGCVRWLSKHGVEDGTQIVRSVKRHRQTDVKNEAEDQHWSLSTEVDRPLNHSRPHKSRKRSAED